MNSLRLAKLYAENRSGGARKAGGIQLIRAAWEQVIDVLSDEQKGLWDALLQQSINKSRQRGAGPRLIRVTPG